MYNNKLYVVIAELTSDATKDFLLSEFCLILHIFLLDAGKFTEFSVSSYVLSPPDHNIGMHKEKNNNKHLMFITEKKTIKVR